MIRNCVWGRNYLETSKTTAAICNLKATEVYICVCVCVCVCVCIPVSEEIELLRGHGNILQATNFPIETLYVDRAEKISFHSS